MDAVLKINLKTRLALCLGGALSNALDRLLYGAVADFFHFHWQDWSFYIFNLADMAITAGVLLLILDVLGIGRKRSIQILEYFDRVGLTRRLGDQRYDAWIAKLEFVAEAQGIASEPTDE